MKQFLKNTEVQLINGGYLSNKEGKPVYNLQFINAQKHAEYVVTFATLAKGKDFTGKKADSLLDLEIEVRKALQEKAPKFIEGPEAPSSTMTDKLAAEAKAFMTYKDGSNKVEKTNEFLQQFNIIKEFEDFGLFFEDDIVKLNKIYTMEEIISAVSSVIDLLK